MDDQIGNNNNKNAALCCLQEDIQNLRSSKVKKWKKVHLRKTNQKIIYRKIRQNRL